MRSYLLNCGPIRIMRGSFCLFAGTSSWAARSEGPPQLRPSPMAAVPELEEAGAVRIEVASFAGAPLPARSSCYR